MTTIVVTIFLRGPYSDPLLGLAEVHEHRFDIGFVATKVPKAP